MTADLPLRGLQPAETALIHPPAAMGRFAPEAALAGVDDFWIPRS
jgi:hypothetical protein